jgi:glutamate dehydrogenase
VFRIGEDTGAPPSDIAHAYAIAREVFDMPRFWEDVEALDNVVAAETQLGMLLEARRLVERATRWLLRNRRSPLDIAAEVSRFSPGARALSQALPEILVEAERASWDEHVSSLVADGVPEPLAARVASLAALFSALDVVEVASDTGRPVADVAALHFLLGGRLHLHWLRDQIAELPRSNRWEAMARAALRDDLFGLHAELTADVMREGPAEGAVGVRLDAWMAANTQPVARCLEILGDIRTAGTYDLTTLPVALREVRNLIQSTAPVSGDRGRPAAAVEPAQTAG